MTKPNEIPLPETLVAMSQAKLEFEEAVADRIRSTNEKALDACRHIVKSMKAQAFEAVRFNDFERADSLIQGLRVHVAHEAEAFRKLRLSMEVWHAYNGELIRRSMVEKGEAA